MHDDKCAQMVTYMNTVNSTCKEGDVGATLKDRSKADATDTTPMYPPVTNWTPAHSLLSARKDLQKTC